MSRTIEEILEVVQEVREGFRNEHGGRSVTSLRIQAVKSVAKRRGIYSTTVSNKFRRELRPEIDGTAAFDQLLEDWLAQGSNELKNIILKHKSDPGDVEFINSVFHIASELELLLAEEFGFDPGEDSFKEGQARLKLHLTRERNQSLVKRAKDKWHNEHAGLVCCLICGFSFTAMYGQVGEGFIEAHHTRPISSLAPNTLITVADLAPVCSNCHSILHRRRPWPTVSELHRIVLRQRDLGPD